MKGQCTNFIWFNKIEIVYLKNGGGERGKEETRTGSLYKAIGAC